MADTARTTRATSLERALAASVLNQLSSRLRANDLAVLAYHGVEDADRFAAHLDHLRDHTNPISVHDLAESLQGRPLPERAVLVTFDDGDRTVLTTAAPLLEERSIPAICFVVTALLGTDSAFWWDEAAAYSAPGTGVETVRRLKTMANSDRLAELDEMRREAADSITRRQLDADDLAALIAHGVAIGNHTHSHPCLDRCTGGEVGDEIRQSHDVLSGLLGEPCRWFAYPNGNLDRRAEATLVSLGYAGAFLFDHRLARRPESSPMRISRLRVNATTPLHRLELILSGLHPRLHRLRGRS